MLHGRLVLVHLMVAMPLVSMSLVVMVSLGVVDIGNVALVPINMVLDSLQATIGKMHMVLPTGVMAITLLAVTKLGAVVGVVDVVAIFVVGRVVVVLAVAMTVIRLCITLLSEHHRQDDERCAEELHG